jgi:hypothetical protein
MLVIVAITHAWIVVSIFTGCVPLAGLWDVETHMTAYCHPPSVYWSHSGINIGTDFLIFLLPLAVLRKLNVPRRQKIALYCVFLVAFWYVGSLNYESDVSANKIMHCRCCCSVCIISLLRTLEFIKVMIINPAVDTSREGVVIAIWTMFEVNMAVVCACLTTIKPVLARFFPRLLSPTPGTDEDESAPWSGAMERVRGKPGRSLDGDVPVDVDLAIIGGKEAGQSSAPTSSNVAPESARMRGALATETPSESIQQGSDR